MKSSQSVHKIVCWRLSGLHKIVTWHKNSSQISQSAVTWPPGYLHKVVTLSKNKSQKRHLTTYNLSQISHRTIIWRFEVCHSVVLRWYLSRHMHMAEKPVKKWSFDDFWGCFWDDIKVVIRRLIQMRSFGRLWGVRFWHQFDNPKVVYLTTLFFECVVNTMLIQNHCLKL